MNVSLTDLLPLSLDLALCAGILLTFVADLFSGPKPNRAIGVIPVATFAGALIASFQMDLNGSAFGGVYVGDHWSLFFKRAFLAAGLLATLGSIDHVAKRQPHRQGEYYLLLMFSVLGMTLLPGARDLVFLIVAFELMGLPLFILAAYAKTEDPKGVGRTVEAGLKLYRRFSAAITVQANERLRRLTGDARGHPQATLLFVWVMLVLAGGLQDRRGALPCGCPTHVRARRRRSWRSCRWREMRACCAGHIFHGAQTRSEWQPILLGCRW
jgi:hypothetical protein